MTQTAVEFLQEVYTRTAFEDTEDAEKEFAKLRTTLSHLSQHADGKKILQQCVPLAMTVAAEATLKDVIKIIWRMVKSMSGTPHHKLCLFIMGVNNVYTQALSTRGSEVNKWIQGIYVWLGKQLTIGGKGVTGDGEGTVEDRIKRFFTTPYLHDFD